VWGLSVHPSQNQFLSVSYDKMLYLWDTLTRRAIWSKQLPVSHLISISLLTVLSMTAKCPHSYSGYFGHLSHSFMCLPHILHYLLHTFGLNKQRLLYDAEENKPKSKWYYRSHASVTSLSVDRSIFSIFYIQT